MNDRQKEALLNVLNFLADEEISYYCEADPDIRSFHIWNDREILRQMYEEMEEEATPEHLETAANMKRYEVHINLICGGWKNCWYLNGTPHTFSTLEEAQEEINEYFSEVAYEISQGQLSEDSRVDPEDYRIYDRKTGRV